MDPVYVTIAAYATNGMICLLYLVGIVAGIIFIVKRRKLPGILTIVGFALLGFDVLFTGTFYLIIYSILNMALPVETASTINICGQGLISFLGTAALIAGIFTGIMPKKSEEGI